MQAIWKKYVALMLAFIALATPLYGATWFESYQKGKEAIGNQQWDVAVRELSDAIRQKPRSDASAKTYGLRFIDYFPYAYRGLAYYNLGQLEKATADFNQEDSYGAVSDPSDDTEAREILKRTRALMETQIAAKNSQTQQPIATSEPPKTELPKTETKTEPPPKTESVKPANDAKKISGLLADGTSLYSQRKLDDAEKKFAAVLDIEKNNSEAKNYLSKIRTDKSKLASTEAEYQQGVRYFNDNKFGLAEAKFRAVVGDRPDARSYLTRIDNIKKEIQSNLSQGEYEFNRKNYDTAEDRFLAVLKYDTENQKAKNFLQQIKSMRGTVASQSKSDDAFNEAAALFKEGKLGQAKQKFQILQASGSDKPGLQGYLDDIAKAETQSRQGIKEFLEGNYDGSITTLSDVSRRYVDNPTIYAFLAGAYAGKYFLRGGEDKDLMTKARASYAHVHEIQRDFELDKTYVSPKIVQLLTINQ